jgi:hypothetical protein
MYRVNITNVPIYNNTGNKNDARRSDEELTGSEEEDDRIKDEMDTADRTDKNDTTLSPAAKLELQVSALFSNPSNLSSPFVLLLNILSSRGKRLFELLREHDNMRSAESGTNRIPLRHIFITNGSAEVLVTIKALIYQ